MPNFGTATATIESMKNPFTSKRVQDVPEPDAPSAFQQFGGWGSADEATGARLDPIESEREQRLAGALALVQLEAQRLERMKAEREAQLASVRRGTKYG
jgi:hypothetical protein